MTLFTATWCKHCQKVKQYLDLNDISITICDVDKDQELPSKHGVTQLPALLRNDGTLMVESNDIITYIGENA